MSGGYTNADKEVVTKTLKVESKLFYLDLKENARGRYLKISEKAAGTRSTVIVPSIGIAWFVDYLNYYASNNYDEGSLTTKELQLETKVFYFDVGENPRGRFLRISERGGTASRSLLIIPDGGTNNSGWVSFAQALSAMNDAHQQLPIASESVSVDEMIDGIANLSTAGGHSSNTFFANSVGPSAPPSGGGLVEGAGPDKVLRSGQKRFFFDVGSNLRGSYLRITEVVGQGNDRSSVVVPTEVLDKFYELLGSWVETAKSQPTSSQEAPSQVHQV